MTAAANPVEMNMRPDFETALMDLIDRYVADTPREDIVSAMELRVMAMREEDETEVNSDD